MNNVKLGYTTCFHNQLHVKLLQMDMVILLLYLSPFALGKNPHSPRERTHQVLYNEQCEIRVYHPLPHSASCQTSSDGYDNLAAISFSICTRKNLTLPGNKLIKCYTMNNVKLGYTTRYHNQLHVKLLQMDTVILLLFLSPFALGKTSLRQGTNSSSAIQ
jgi:hypothetical protein